MATTTIAASPEKAWLWAPRLLALAVSLFLGVFSLDVFSDGRSFFEALPDFLMHLVPAAIVIAIVALAWRREWIGGVAFTALAAAYAIVARDHVSWIAVISGPLALVAVLYLWVSTRRQKQAAA